MGDLTVVLRSAWRQFALTRNAAVGLALVLVICFHVGWILNQFPNNLFGDGLCHWFFGSPGPDWSHGKFRLVWITTYWAEQLASIPLMMLIDLICAGYVWMVMHSFDSGRIVAGDLLQPLRRPTCWVLLRYFFIVALVETWVRTIHHVAINDIRNAIVGSGTFSHLGARVFLSADYAADYFMQSLIMLATCLVVPIILSRPELGVRGAFREYFGVFRRQRGLIVGVTVLWLIGVLIFRLVPRQLLYGSSLSLFGGFFPIESTPYLASFLRLRTFVPFISASVWDLVFLYVVVAAFRASSELTLEQNRSGQAS
jgi:hypothetical protein